jgi:hypothetical protein
MELARRQAPLLGNGEVVRRGSVRRLTPRVVHQNPDPRLDPLSAEFVPGSSGGSDDNHTAGHMANGNASYRATVAAGVASPSEQSKGGALASRLAATMARSTDTSVLNGLSGFLSARRSGAWVIWQPTNAAFIASKRASHLVSRHLAHSYHLRSCNPALPNIESTQHCHA